jgi:uroporphyrinogen-III synthase
MEQIVTILKELNLIYYEYDITTNKLIVDKICTQDEIYQEFIKVTYTLTKNEIKFFVDENKDIVISKEDGFFSRLTQRVKNIFSGIKNSHKNIYILSDKKIKYAHNFPVITINPIIEKIDLQDYDALIFTSKNAIHTLNEINENWKKISSYVIAPQSAKYLKWCGGKLEYVGKSKYGDEFAQELIPLLKGRKVLYLGGKRVVSNLVDILKDKGIDCHQEAIYETVCKKYPNKIHLPKNSIIIFSSPSTIECFLENAYWDESFQAISIGKTTAKYFPSYIQPIVSENTSLDGCVQTALRLK